MWPAANAAGHTRIGSEPGEHPARDAVDLLGGQIRECSATDCALLFLDTSRAGWRRWCSLATCGAGAKMATYRACRASIALRAGHL